MSRRNTGPAATLLLSAALLAGCDGTTPPLPGPEMALALERTDSVGVTRVEVRSFPGGDLLATGPDWSGEPTLHHGRLIYTQLDGEGAHLVESDLHLESMRRLRDTPVRETAPALSPDGLRLAFLRHEGAPAVWTSTASGDGARRLLPPEALHLEGSPAWLPNGRVVMGGPRGGRGAIFRDNGTLPPVPIYTPDYTVYHPAASPGGRLLAVLAVRGGRTHAEIFDFDRVVGYKVAGTDGAKALTWTEDGMLLIAVPGTHGTVILGWRPGENVRSQLSVPGRVRNMAVGHARRGQTNGNDT